VDHHLFAQLGRHNVRQPAEGGKDPVLQALAERLEEAFFTEKRHAAANHDAPGAEQADDEVHSEGEGIQGGSEHGLGQGIAASRRLRDMPPR
jgi:hypothetical protein